MRNRKIYNIIRLRKGFRNVILLRDIKMISILSTWIKLLLLFNIKQYTNYSGIVILDINY